MIPNKGYIIVMDTQDIDVNSNGLVGIGGQSNLKVSIVENAGDEISGLQEGQKVYHYDSIVKLKVEDGVQIFALKIGDVVSFE